MTRIPLEPVGSGVDHFIPGVAVNRSTSDGTAALALAFYFYPTASCTTATCQLEVGTSTSSDGGASWTSNALVAGPMLLTWLANTTQGFMVGDYISTSFSDDAAFPAFAVASPPSGTTLDEDMFTVRGGLTVGGTANPAGDQVTILSNNPQTFSTLTDQ